MVFLIECEGTIVPPDVLRIGKQYGQKGLQTYEMYTHSECIEAIRYLSLDASKYYQDEDRVTNYTFIYANRCQSNTSTNIKTFS